MSSFLHGDDILTPELLARLSKRIQEGLESEPVAVEAAEHRRRIADLLARVGQLNHYELLGIDESANERQIYDAYVEVARLVHPAHVQTLSLEGLAVGPELLFERATLAYLTLSDDARRLDYHVEAGLVSSRSGPVSVGSERQDEERDQARKNYETAKSMADAGEYHYAIELLYVATRVDPKAEYFALLGRCERENPNWRRKAIRSYSKAVELDPADDASRFAVAELYEQDNNLPMARREYAALLERVPGHPDATEALRRLK